MCYTTICFGFTQSIQFSHFNTMCVTLVCVSHQDAMRGSRTEQNIAVVVPN